MQTIRLIKFLFQLLRAWPRWRDLPERFGDNRTVKRRYYDWVARGVLDRILEALSAEADLEWLMVDATIIRAHQHAAGAAKSKGGLMPKALAARAAG